MRTAMWILAACGIVGLVIRIGTAEDGPFPQNQFSWVLDADPTSPTDSETGKPARYIRQLGRSGKTSETDNTVVPRVKNDSRELFGTEESPARGAENTDAVKVPHVDALLQGTVFQEPGLLKWDTVRDESRRGITSRITFPVRSAVSNTQQQPNRIASKLIHAEYEQPNGKNQPNKIRQVRLIDDAPNPFAPSRKSRAPADSAATRAANEQAAKPLPSLPAAVGKTTVVTPTGLTKLVPPAADAVGPQMPMITLYWMKRNEINVGQECECQLHVKNNGKAPAKSVTVDAFFPTSVQLTSAKPAPIDSPDHLSWNFSVLAPGEERIIHIRIIPSRRGELKTTALVRFSGAASGLFSVKEPLLKLSIKGPTETLIGDPASQVIMVTNPGTGVATNVTITTLLPEGLEHLRGEQLLMEIGSLNPGETRIVKLALAAVKGGQQKLKVQATADAGLRKTLEQTIEVVTPSLKVSIAGPELRYVGRIARYTLTVTNDGAAASNNVRVNYKVPMGYKFSRAEEGGKYDPATREVNWFVGRLETGKSALLKVDLTASQTGNFTHHAGATAEHGVTVESQITAQIEGTAALVVQIVERNDPVEVATETAFEVRVGNEGSKSAQKIGLSIELPAGVEFLKAHGPSQHLAENGLVIFKSLDRLDSGKIAIFRIHVRGTSAGNHRLRARLASESILESLITEELTKYYVK